LVDPYKQKYAPFPRVMSYRIWSLNRLGVGIDPQNLGMLGFCSIGMGTWLTRTCLSTCVVIPGQTIRAYLWRFPEKKSEHRVPPLKVTQGHWNQHVSIGYLRLPISDPYIVTMGLSRTVSVENRKSYRSLPVHLTPPLAQFRLEFRNGGIVSKKTRAMLPPICAFVYQSVMDRRTD